jgi:hypothetical protein
MTTRPALSLCFGNAALAATLLLAATAGAEGERAAYRAFLGPDATLGLWSVWEVAQNRYLLTLSLEPDEASPPLRLFNAEIAWDALKLVPAGPPQPGTLFEGQPEQWFGHYDTGARRTVTWTLLGDVAGVAPAGPTTLFSQLFHAVDPAGGAALIDLVSLTLRDPDNLPISVAAEDEVLLTLDVTPPQGYLFDIVALLPSGNQLWTAQTLVASSLAPGDGSLAGLLLNESPALPANSDPAWQVPPAPATFTLSSGDGLKTVRAWLRDHYGNRLPLTDAITLDTQAPMYHVTQLDARPRHEGCLVTWNNPIAPDFDRVRLYRRGWSDDGVPRYPEYDDIDPMSPYPESEAAALAAGFALAYEGGGQSWLDPVVPRDVYRYVAFCLDHAGNVGPGHASARDRSTNYILGDTWVAWDGTVFVRDLVRLAAGYATAEGDLLYDAHLDYGPTDDHRRDGIPLTDNLVGFEDLMIFAMNYGPFGPVLAVAGAPDKDPAHRGQDGGAELAQSWMGSRLALALAGEADWLGLHLLLAWEESAAPPTVAAGGEARIVQSGAGRLLLDRIRLPGEDPAALLAELDFGPAGPPAGLRVAELALRDGANAPLTVRGGGGPRPSTLEFQGACPNPFNPETLLRFTLPAAAPVEIVVYNALGQRVRRLEPGELAAGAHALRLSGEGLASGVYLLELRAGAETRRQRALLLR